MEARDARLRRADRRFEAPELLDALDHAVRYHAHLRDAALAFAGPARRVLDFGAGTGRLAADLAARGLDVVAVEPDPGLRARIEARGVAAVADLAELEGCSFDYAVSANALEHCPDDAAVLRALHARLAPGGRLLLYVPAFPLLWSANDTRVGHQRRYRRGPLGALVHGTGFRVADVRHVDSLGFAVALAYRVLGPRDGDLTPGAVRLYDRLLFPASLALDRLLHPWLGKNLLLRAYRD